MLRTYIYLPDELNQQIKLTADLQRKSKAEIIRRALEKGLAVVKSKKSDSAKILLQIAKEAEKLHVKGPKDLSFNHDYYTWGGPKRNIKTGE